MSVSPAETFLDVSSVSTWSGSSSDSVVPAFAVKFTFNKARLIIDKCLALIDIYDMSYVVTTPAVKIESTTPKYNEAKCKLIVTTCPKNLQRLSIIRPRN